VERLQVLDRYVNKEDESLSEILKTAEGIMDQILGNEKITGMVSAIRDKNEDLYDHSMVVAGLSMVTAIKMNMDPTYVYSIGVGALLHDQGLKDIEIDYIDKDQNMLSPEDLFEYKKHTVYGFSEVENESWMSSASKKIVLFHHEKLNGSGYPLKQTIIPPEVRIVSVCDTFDDMIRGIGYKQADAKDACQYLKDYQDAYYDSRIVDIFLQLIEA
jgi:HD-GYP domain-containing protein (c-di-GMP phosphodiesterase class II)